MATEAIGCDWFAARHVEQVERPIEDSRKFLAGGVEIERQKEVSRLGVRADSDHITRQNCSSSNYSMIISEDTGKSLTPAGGLRFST